MPQVTENLRRFNAGDPNALDELLPEIYLDLRRLAAQRRAGERAGHTLTSTALVHETYLRLLQQKQLVATDRTEFLAVAAVTMRRILVDYARARGRKKRGGGASLVPLEDVEPFLSNQESLELLDLHAALERLELRSPRSAAVVQLRFFGGLSVEDVADHLDVTVRTVHRDWVSARAWLRTQVSAPLVEEV